MLRIERGNKRSKPFSCIRYFFIRPVVHLLRENRLRDLSMLRSGGGTWKTMGERGKEENPPRGEEPDVTEGRCMGARGCSSAKPHEPNREGEEKKRRVNSRTMIFYLFLKYVNRLKMLVAHVDVRYIRGLSGTSVRLAE